MVRVDGFKPYNQEQTMLLPLSLDEFIPAGHKARIISAVVDRLDLSRLYNTYCTTVGQDAYDPRMLVKVLFYATFLGIFSSREIESHLHTDTAFMYLAAMQKPTYRTISRFRSRFFEELVPIFEQIVQICQELDLVGLNHVAFDGSKIKANASPKKTLTPKQLRRRIKKLLGESVKTDEEEDGIFGAGTPYLIPEEFAQDADLKGKIESLVAAYNQLQDSGDKRINLTDEDARTMKCKQALLPAYNFQTAVDDKSQIIVAAAVTTDENDYHQFVPMVEQVVQTTGKVPTVCSADPGYATYDTYEYLKANGLYGLIPDTMHFIETYGHPKYYPKSRFLYNPEHDQYTCPAGRTMKFVRVQKDKFGQPLRLYQGNCSWCPLHLSCTRAERRSITRHPKEELKDEMRKRLATPEGKKEYAKRITVAEAPFGNMKENKRWRQLSHRGLEKVKGECLLHAIGHNLGVICRNVPIERIKNLPIVQRGSPSGVNSVAEMLDPAMVGYDGGVEAPSCYRSGSVGGCEIQIVIPDYRTGIICS
ncbi:MAG: IS1182 family transposase [Methanoculleus sp.]|jgi:transposase